MCSEPRACGARTRPLRGLAPAGLAKLHLLQNFKIFKTLNIKFQNYTALEV
tara:strand:- start:36 stop:188 length:153 start_codon:yes stop_codon:yes gene_type:complete